MNGTDLFWVCGTGEDSWVEVLSSWLNLKKNLICCYL